MPRYDACEIKFQLVRSGVPCALHGIFSRRVGKTIYDRADDDSLARQPSLELVSIWLRPWILIRHEALDSEIMSALRGSQRGPHIIVNLRQIPLTGVHAWRRVIGQREAADQDEDE